MGILHRTFFLTLLFSFGKSEYDQKPEPLITPKGNLYALLVAGSNGWWNYRHQANVAHSYQLLLKKGVPAENIIVMMYDDVVVDSENPYPGKLFNRPHGPDVYAGLKIDYSGDSVTPYNFLNILQGNAQNVTGGSGRVIESTSQDRIFVYFTDHGGYGMVLFPHGLMKGKISALQFGLLQDDHYSYNSSDSCVYAMTATNAHESANATYCDNDMNLPCLGDLFSVNWMEDSEKHDIDKETLLTQFKNVKKLTNLSHVMHYGDLNITSEPVSWFQGGVSSSSVSLVVNDDEDRRNIEALVKSIVASLLPNDNDRKEIMEKRNAVEHLKCHNDVVKAFHSTCVDVNKFDYALKYIEVLNNLCVKIGDWKKIITAMHTTCSTIGKQYL